MKIEYIQKIGNYEFQKVALFNMMKVTEEEGKQAIELDGVGYDPNVIIIYKEQFENVFSE